MQMNTSDHSIAIRQKALDLGFSGCGFSKAGFLTEEASHFETWLKKGHSGSMSYMEQNIDKRLDPGLLVDGAKTVISLIYNYYPEPDFVPEKPYKIARFGLGLDYHTVIKNKLFELAGYLNQIAGEASFRVFIDSAPVLERAWAVKSGLGWIGKNACFITTKKGSFFLLAEIITGHELPPDIQPVKKDYCGSCSRCIDYCPTGAIIEPRVIDARRCITYLNTELKDSFIPQEFREHVSNQIFGCDICQEVCPWNRFSEINHNNELETGPLLKNMTHQDWDQLNEESFNELFKQSGIKRIGYSGLMRNIRFIKKT